ncbi:MAG: hypothetical protein ACI89M_002374, partial [Chitinophagales bacterium]
MKLRLLIGLFSLGLGYVNLHAQEDEIPTMTLEELDEFSTDVKPFSRSLLLDFRDIYGNAAQWNLGGE